MKKTLSILFLLWACLGTSQTIITKNPVASVLDKDNQQITDFSLAGNILSITIEGGNTKTVDLTPIVGNVTITTFSVVGSTLTLTLSNGSTANVELPSGSGSTSLSAGTNVSITGTGTSGDPYVISATGGGETTETIQTKRPIKTVNGSTLEGSGNLVVTGGEAIPQLDSKAVEVTSASDLSAGGSAGKNLYITTDINLTGNITVASGATLIGSGGVITVGANVLTFQNNGFYSSNPDTFIDLGQSGTINNSSTFKSAQDINLNWFGLVNDGTYPGFTGTDNHNVLFEASKIANYSGGILRITKPGIYLKDVKEDVFSKYTPTNWYLGSPSGSPQGGASLYLSEGVIIQEKPTPRGNSSIIAFYNFRDITIEGGLFRGSSRVFDYGGNGDGRSGFGIKSFGDGLTIKSEVTETTGSGIQAAYNPEFAYPNSIVEASFTKGFDLDAATGSPISSTQLNYSNRYNISSAQFNSCDCFAFGGGSYGGARGMSTPYYYVAFYDSTSIDGNTTTGYLGKTDLLETYEKYEIPPGATHARIIIWTPDVWANLEQTLYAPTHSKNIRIESKRISRGKYQGMSNMSPYGVVDGVTFEDNGRDFNGVMEVGDPGNPGAGVDQEDGYENLQKTSFLNSVYRNNKNGDVLYKASRDIFTHGNWYVPNDYPGGFVKTRLISLESGHRTRFNNNYVFDREISTGRGDDVSNNSLFNVIFTFSNENETIRDNVIAYNISFTEKLAADTTGLTYIMNNHFLYNKPLNPTTSMIGRHEGVAWINNRFIFEPGMVAGNNSKLSNLGTVSNNGGVARGWIDGLYVTGIKGATLNSDGWQTYAYNIKNVETSISLDVRRGQSNDFTLENVDITGWLTLYLTDYPTTNGGDPSLYSTTTLKDVNVTIDNSSLLAGTSYAFLTQAKDVNVVWTGGSINMNVSSTKFMDLNHYGTTMFKDVKFTAASAQTVNLSTLVSGDTAYFIDCEFENVTFTLRAGDKFLYTKPHPDLEVYADNTAALAGGIPAGYLYRTSDGTVKTVF